MNLPQIRKQIDEIDQGLLQLLNARTSLAEEVGRIKRESGQAVFAPEREEQLLRALERKNAGPLSNRTLRAIYREILSASREKQKQLNIAYLGPEATYCHQASMERFGSSDRFTPYRTIPEIFSAVSQGEADAGVVPIENSIEGGVNATHDALVGTDLSICGEIFVRVRHELMASSAKGKILRIYSHQQAFGQCRNWLLRHYPGAQQVEVSSTAHGAERAAREKEAAAIASPFAAHFYKLNVRHRNIQDAQKNLTRFLILGRTQPAHTAHDKTSLLFSVSHEVGALSHVLRIFADNKLNLQKIESRPAVQKEWEYLFFVDISGHINEPRVKKAMTQIKAKTLWLKVLGSYPQGTQDV